MTVCSPHLVFKVSARAAGSVCNLQEHSMVTCRAGRHHQVLLDFWGSPCSTLNSLFYSDPYNPYLGDGIFGGSGLEPHSEATPQNSFPPLTPPYPLTKDRKRHSARFSAFLGGIGGVAPDVDLLRMNLRSVRRVAQPMRFHRTPLALWLTTPRSGTSP